MKKLVLFLIFMIGMISTSSHAAFERLRDFFTGDRYYYGYDNDSYYYYPYNRKYVATTYYPRSPKGYGRPRYARARSFDRPQLIDTNTTIDEDPTKYVITVTLPDYNKSDIQIFAFERSIQLKANASTQTRVQGSVLSDISSVEQVIPLNVPIKPEAVTSDYVNGVLTIRAPKLSASNAVAVPISDNNH